MLPDEEYDSLLLDSNGDGYLNTYYSPHPTCDNNLLESPSYNILPPAVPSSPLSDPVDVNYNSSSGNEFQLSEDADDTYGDYAFNNDADHSDLLETRSEFDGSPELQNDTLTQPSERNIHNDDISQNFTASDPLRLDKLDSAICWQEEEDLDICWQEDESLAIYRS